MLSRPWIPPAKRRSSQGLTNYTIADITMSAVSAVQQWAETDDLDDGESYADRLMALVVGIADADEDGDVTEDEQGVLEVALNAAWDYLVKCGATEEDAGALLNDWDDEAADRVRDLVASVLPEGDDEASAEIDNFVFSDSDQEPALDAVYKMKMAVRNGKKMRIRKRISGTVRLSAKQKLRHPQGTHEEPFCWRDDAPHEVHAHAPEDGHLTILATSIGEMALLLGSAIFLP